MTVRSDSTSATAARDRAHPQPQLGTSRCTSPPSQSTAATSGPQPDSVSKPAYDLQERCLLRNGRPVLCSKQLWSLSAPAAATAIAVGDTTVTVLRLRGLASDAATSWPLARRQPCCPAPPGCVFASCVLLSACAHASRPTFVFVVATWLSWLSPLCLALCANISPSRLHCLSPHLPHLTSLARSLHPLGTAWCWSKSYSDFAYQPPSFVSRAAPLLTLKNKDTHSSLRRLAVLEQKNGHCLRKDLKLHPTNRQGTVTSDHRTDLLLQL